MRSLKIYSLPLVSVLFLVATAGTALALAFTQCPTLPGGSWTQNGDLNSDGMLRADTCSNPADVPGGASCEIISPVTPHQVCIHLASGDGYVNMADKTIVETNNPYTGEAVGLGEGTRTYMFGFTNVTAYQQTNVPGLIPAGSAVGDVIPDADVAHYATLGMEFPAPTIRVREGDDLYLSLTNVGMFMRPDLFDPHTVHWHGFANASAIFDGLPDSGIAISMGATLTYYYRVVEPGTYMYHCHVEAAEHMQMGMLGNLYVAPAQDGTSFEYPAGRGRTFDTFAYNDGDGSTGYDVGVPIQIASFDPVFHAASELVQPLNFAHMDDKFPMFNGRGYPDNQNPDPLTNTNDNRFSQRMNARIEATAGERILLRITSLSTTSFHTVSAYGLPLQVVGRGSRQLTPENYYTTSSVTLGGGESVDVILDSCGLDNLCGNGDDIPAGTYFFYSTNLEHLANDREDYGGMLTEIHITPP